VAWEAIWAAVEVVSGRWFAEVVSDSAVREVVLVSGEGVGAIAQHRRRLRPRRRILHDEASSMAQHRRRRSIDDGIVHGAVQHRARRNIEDGERSARRFLWLVFLRREIFTARE
jgi:hypothetical protein